MKQILNHQLGMKFGFVLFLLILLQIPVSMLSGLISERSVNQEQVINDIARSSSSEQHIIGPFIMVNYTVPDLRNGITYRLANRKFILPKTFDMSAQLDSFEKYRGIYRARLYKAQTTLRGTFELAALDALRQYEITQISMVVGVRDSRGLIRLDEMALAGKTFEVFPGTGLSQFPQGFHSNLELQQIDLTKPLAFDLNFLLQGTGTLQVAPIGDRSTVELSSAWPHPSFIGDYLPVSSSISESGFKAQWSSNNFSTNIAQWFESCLSSVDSCADLEQRQMGVSLIDPVDHYLKSHRAVNYSLLVMTLVFVSFFLLELFQARPIHPVQYGFVGLALALFYLLLISMSEHMGFNWAYTLSAVASTSLLSIYVGGILNSTKHGMVFGMSLLILYGILFGLLQAENYALLMGTLLCFVVLSFVMLLTRKVDWYQRSNPVSELTTETNRDPTEA
ncbi:cell envelope integrity protein CreD [Agarivorans sp. QJM3NY_29]|uniref:cell envelope integrity protein CreD n=1 Tax=unclassified Agarivorans TaxID=2636026 RepID=UPI003D7E4327